MTPDDKPEDPGLTFMKQALVTLNDPSADARIEAARDKRERRQALVIIGFRAVKDPSAVKDVSLGSIAELGHYLVARKSEETADGIRFTLEVAGEPAVVTAQWSADGEVRFSTATETALAATDDSGGLSTRAVEDALATFK